MQSRFHPAEPKGNGSSRRRLLDETRMLAVFQRELPAMASGPIRVSRCSVQPASRRNGHHRGRRRIVYRVSVHAPGGSRWEHTLVATAPVSRDFLSPELLHRCRVARLHPAVRPFTRLATYVDDLEMALLLLPVDPALPGLVEITGHNRGRLLSPHLEECRRGGVVRRADWTVHRYQPVRRCELSLDVDVEAAGSLRQRRVLVTIYADDSGAVHHRNMKAVWAFARTAPSLRLPRPLGYDAEHRLLFTEPAGRRLAGNWIRCLARNHPLPQGVDLARVERCLVAAARALTELQQADLALSEERTFRGELAHLHRNIERVRSVHPQASTAFGRLLDSLGGQPVDDEQLCPAHGRFRPERLAGEDGDLTIVEWEAACLASPAFDAATFLGRLRSLAVFSKGGTEAIEHLAGAFRQEYLQRGSATTSRDLAMYESLVLARHALQAARRTGSNGQVSGRVLRLAEAGLHRLETSSLTRRGR